MTARRTFLLAGTAGLLAGCDTITDTADRLLGNRKVPLPGERRPVIALAERGLRPDPQAAARPFSLPPPAPLEAWPQPGGTPDHAPGHATLGAPLREAWRANAGSGSGWRQRLTQGPVAAADTVFTIDAFGWVSAFDAAGGRRRWQTDTRPRGERDGALGGGIAFDGGTIYAVTGLSEALALDAADGTIRWRAPLPAPARGAITVAGGRLHAVTIDNRVVALSVEDGRQLWAFRGTETQAIALGLAAPAVADNLVVAGLPSGELTALRSNDGRPAWTELLGGARVSGASLADLGAVVAKPVVDRGRVFAMGLGGSAVALDLRSGRRVWEREIAGIQTPWSLGDWVFMMSVEGVLACLGRDDGRVRWIAELPSGQGEGRRRTAIAWGGPVLAGGRLLIAGSHGVVQEIDPADGALGPTVRLPDGALLQPALAGGALYYLTENATLVALRGA